MEGVGAGAGAGLSGADYPTPLSPRHDPPGNRPRPEVVRIDPSRETEQRTRVIETVQRVAVSYPIAPLGEAEIRLQICRLPEGGWAEWTREVFDFDPFDCSLEEDPFLPALNFLKIPRALEEYRDFVISGGVTTPRALLQLFYIMEHTPVLSEDEYDDLTERPEFLQLCIEVEQKFGGGLPKYGLFQSDTNARGPVDSPAHNLFDLLQDDSSAISWFEDLFSEITLDDARRVFVLKKYQPSVDWDAVSSLIGLPHIGAVCDMVATAEDVGSLDALFAQFGWGERCSMDLFELVESLTLDYEFQAPLADQVEVTEESLGIFFDQEVTDATLRQFKILYTRFSAGMVKMLRFHADRLVHWRSQYLSTLSASDQMSVWGAYSIVNQPFIVTITLPSAPLWWIRGMISREYNYGNAYSMARAERGEIPQDRSQTGGVKRLLHHFYSQTIFPSVGRMYPDAPVTDKVQECCHKAAQHIVDFACSSRRVLGGLRAADLTLGLTNIFGRVPPTLEAGLQELRAKEEAQQKSDA